MRTASAAFNRETGQFAHVVGGNGTFVISQRAAKSMQIGSGHKRGAADISDRIVGMLKLDKVTALHEPPTNRCRLFHLPLSMPSLKDSTLAAWSSSAVAMIQREAYPQHQLKVELDKPFSERGQIRSTPDLVVGPSIEGGAEEIPLSNNISDYYNNHTKRR